MSLKRTVTYIDNRGYEHDVRTMDTSHILNVLNLIKNQIHSVNYFGMDTDFVDRMVSQEAQICLVKSLRKDAKVLCKELDRRFTKGGCKRLKETA